MHWAEMNVWFSANRSYLITLHWATTRYEESYFVLQRAKTWNGKRETAHLLSICKTFKKELVLMPNYLSYPQRHLLESHKEASILLKK